MPTNEPFPIMLSGGHPNSLGRTVEVVELILADPTLLPDLYACYDSADEVVRLRTSNAFKRIWRAEPSLIVPYIDRFLARVGHIDQDSARWTTAQLFAELDAHLSPPQRAAAIALLKSYIETNNDWIVLSNTMQTLGKWAADDAALKMWLLPHLQQRTHDSRKSVARNANKVLATLQ